MRIMFTKKCFVKGQLRDAGEIIDVDSADDYEGVAKALEPKKEAEAKPEAKPKAPLRTGLKTKTGK